MTNQESSKEESTYEKCLNFKEKIIKPFLEEFWHLRFPVFTGVLSFFFFAGIGPTGEQMRDIYRVFALDPQWRMPEIGFSFFFISLLSFSIWHSGRRLSTARKNELVEKYKEREEALTKYSTKQHKISLVSLKCQDIIKYLRSHKDSGVSAKIETLLWLPRILGTLPLLALCLGLIFTPATSESQKSLIAGRVFAFLLLVIFIIVVINRKAFVQSCRTNSDRLFSPCFQSFVLSSSILVFSVFALPFINYGEVETFRIITSFVAIAILAVIFLRTKSHGQKSKTLTLLSLLYLLIATILLLLVSYYPTSISLLPFLGPISIVALFLSVFVLFTSSIFYQGYKTKFPILTGFIILAFICSLFNLNDNHRLREYSSLASKSEYPLPSLEKSFNTWVEYRKKDISKFDEKKPYPIYVVSAQGGGIFAAYHAALTLSRLQDLSLESNSDFASHIFAISGVSGGSLGATVFSSLVKAEGSGNSPLKEGCHDGTLRSLQNTPPKVQLLDPKSLEAKAHCLLAQDFLSPLLTAGLFPDFVQRFIPSVPLLSNALDRARGLEYAFEQAWFNKPWVDSLNIFKVTPEERAKNPLAASYYEHWIPEGKAPALVLNTTVVETGERLLLSPFTFKAPPNSRFPVLADISTVACPADKERHHIDFPLSTAAVLSARFPIVTPVGWFEKCNNKNGNLIDKGGHLVKGENGYPRSRLADGGYFENSGLSTALAIGKFLKNQEDKYKKKGLRFKVVYLALTDNSFIEPDAGSFNEIGAPLGAFYNARDARGRTVVEQAEYEIDGDKSKNLSGHEFRQFYLTHAAPKIPVSACTLSSKSKDCKPVEKNNKNSDFKLPLGWYLSGYSQEYIRERIGHPRVCPLGKSNQADNNHCVMKSIIDELSPPSMKSTVLKEQSPGY